VDPTPDSLAEPFKIEQIRTYCRLEATPVVANMPWDGLEEATHSTIETIKSSGRSQLLVDLSQLESVRSGTTASLVRIWKSLDRKSRRFVVVSPHPRVRQELESAGLQKLWTIVNNREEAAYELGVSRSAEVEERELRILALAAFPCALLAVLATAMMFRDGKEAIQVNAQLAALLLGAVSLTVGIVSVLKDSGFRRLLSAFAIVVSLSVLATLFFERNAIGFPFSAEPARQVESE
jgi:anti-anti-sigma factor